MPVEVIDEIVPKNDAGFAIASAKNIKMPDERRLDAYLDDMKEELGGGTIPTYDLVALGLPEIDIGGADVELETDTTEILADLEAGAVRFAANMAYQGVNFTGIVFTMHDISNSICSCVFSVFGIPILVTLTIETGKITANGTLLAVDDGEEAAADTPATSIDMTAFDSAGQIVETFADGTSKTTTIEFDEDGNPVKITDGYGNVTTLTW